MNRGVLAGLGPGDSPDVLAGDAGQNAVLVAGNRKEVSFSTTTAQIVALTDCSDYRYVSVHHVTQGTSSTMFFEGSNDNINWVAVSLVKLANTPVVQANSSTAGTISVGMLSHRYFRLNVTGISAGTTAGVVEFSSMPGPPAIQAVYINGSISSGIAVTPGVFPADGSAGVSEFPVAPAGYNGASYDRLRVPTIFKTATATASGDTALWTPTSGKKFRLMRYQIQITGDASTSGGGVIDILLRDATTSIAVGYSLYVPATAVSALGADNSEWIDLGNGFLSALANNVLNVNLSAALATGKVRVVVCGTEE